MRATAAIAISLILHCIPQKVTGMEAAASGEEAVVAAHRQFQWASIEGRLFSGSTEPLVEMRPGALKSRSPSPRSIINKLHRSIYLDSLGSWKAAASVEVQQRHFYFPGSHQIFVWMDRVHVEASFLEPSYIWSLWTFISVDDSQWVTDVLKWAFEIWIFKKRLVDLVSFSEFVVLLVQYYTVLFSLCIRYSCILLQFHIQWMNVKYKISSKNRLKCYHTVSQTLTLALAYLQCRHTLTLALLCDQ